MKSLLFAILIPIAAATDFSQMYDAAAMRANRYPITTSEIYNKWILGALKVEESRKLANVRIDFPPVGEREFRGEPLAYYSVPAESRVVMPIFSLKFLDDLCTASAWLELKGFEQDTVSEYAAMLRYKPFAGGRYPAPLPALHIPADALQDSRVNEVGLKLFNTARMFILLHELGHIYIGRTSGDPRESVQIERAADAFASEVMSRTQLPPPLGMVVYFMAAVSMQRYPAPPDDHPVTGERIKALAARMADRDFGAVIAKIGEYAADPDARASIAVTARNTDESTLSPRKGHLQLNSTAPRTPSGLPFDGRYAGQWTQRLDPDPSLMEMILVRRGTAVTGQYSFGLGNVRITNGMISGDELRFDWEWAGKFGKAALRATPGRAGFTGTWGFGNATEGGGAMSAARKN